MWWNQNSFRDFTKKIRIFSFAVKWYWKYSCEPVLFFKGTFILYFLTYGTIDIFRDNVTTIKNTTSHIFSMSGIAFHHLICRFEAGVGNFRNGKLFMISFFGGNDGWISDQGEVNSWVGDQVCLKFSQINIESTIKTKRCSNGRDNLTNDSV